MPEPLVVDTPDPSVPTEPRSRRALLAGGLGGLAGLLAGTLTRPFGARAAAGDPLILGSTTNTSGSAGTKLSSNVNGNAFAVSQTGSGNAANGIRGDAKDGTGGVFTSTNNNALFATVANKDRSAIVAVNAAASAGIGQAAYFDGGVNRALRCVANLAGARVVEIDNTDASGGGLVARASGSGNGVTGTSITGFGVYAEAATSGTAIRGLNNGNGTAVLGTTAGGHAVRGLSVSGDGMQGQSQSGRGVTARSTSGTAMFAVSNSGIGVYGNSASNWSGYFQIDARVENDFQVGGNQSVAGSLSKGGGSFRIDHPLDPANRYLQHSFVESPDMLNVYSGTVTADAAGRASVTMPAWFEALNRDVRYQLTPVGAAMPDLHVSHELRDAAFAIAGAKPNGRVSWQLTGIRHDAWAEANRIAVELDKPEAERGRYLHPREHGQAAERGIGHAVRERALAAVGPPPEDAIASAPRG